jgi:hypothetical protein
MNRQQLLQHLDNVFTLYIKKRDRYACVISGEKRMVGVFYFIKSNNFFIKYDTGNAFMLADRFSSGFENNPVIIMSYIEKTMGLSYFIKLCKISNKQPTEEQIINKINEIVRLTDPIRDRRRWDD